MYFSGALPTSEITEQETSSSFSFISLEDKYAAICQQESNIPDVELVHYRYL